MKKNKTKLMFLLATMGIAVPITACGGNPAPESAVVTVVNGTGGGTYKIGSSVTVSASIPEYKTFKQWVSDNKVVSTLNPYTFTVEKDITLTATFDAVKVQINVNNGTGGGTYDAGTLVTIKPILEEGDTFISWKVDNKVVSTESTYSFIAKTDVTYVAEIEKAVPPADKATVTVINGNGSGEYYIGEEITITATIPEGKKFKDWKKDNEIISTDNPYTFVVDDDITLTAEFARKDSASILAVSDIHITGDDNVTKTHLIKTLQYVIDNKIDIVLINGDLISWATKQMYDYVDGIFTECFKGISKADMPDFIFNMGNHEFYPNSSCRHQDTDYDRETGLFYEFASKWMKEPISDNIYTRTIKGVNIISACPGPEEKDGQYYIAANGVYSDNDISKLKSYLDIMTKDDEPVIVLTHQPWGNTYGGSYRVPSDDVTNKMNGLLKNYPSVINLTSHTHYSNLNERTFNQNDYTSINIGTHAYGKYASDWEKDEDGEIVSFANINNHDIYEDPLSKKYHGTAHFGIGLDFAEGNVIAKRIDLANGVDYEHGTWTIPYGINKDNKSDKFYYEDKERTKEKVNFSQLDKLSVVADVGASTSDLTISFKDVSNYWAVEGYKVEIYDENKALLMEPIWWQSMYWANLNRQAEYEFILKNVKNNPKYDVVVSPNAEVILTQNYKRCGHTITTTEMAPREIVNLGKEKVQEYYNGWNIEEVSANRIKLSINKSGICGEHYILRESDGFISISCKNDSGEYIFKGLTDIPVQYLPQEDIDKLEKGIEIVGKENLNKFLEDFE